MADQVARIVLVVPTQRTSEDRAIEDRLRAARLDVRAVRAGPSALAEIQASPPAVVVFAPAGSDDAAGWTSIPEMRRRGFAGAVLVVGPTAESASAVSALECGAD